MYYVFPWETGNKVSYALLIFIFVLVKICMISGVLLFKHHAKLFSKICNKYNKTVLSVGPDAGEWVMTNEWKEMEVPSIPSL